MIHHADTFPDGEELEAIASVLQALLPGFPDIRHPVENVVASDDYVVIGFRAEGTHDGAFQGYALTRKRVTRSGMNTVRFGRGRIAEEWAEIDGLRRLLRLGVTATPAP